MFTTKHFCYYVVSKLKVHYVFTEQLSYLHTHKNNIECMFPKELFCQNVHYTLIYFFYIKLLLYIDFILEVIHVSC